MHTSMKISFFWEKTQPYVMIYYKFPIYLWHTVDVNYDKQDI